MSQSPRWNSQSLDACAREHAQGRFIELEGKRTHYIEKGAGEPLILLHGFFYHSYLWAANIDALANHFKVYALDLWGWGYSTRDDLDYGYELYARQVLLFMDALGLPRASLLGQSMGSGTAIRFCVQHRQRVDKLLLVAAAGLPNPLPWKAKLLNLRGIGEFLLGLDTDEVRRAALREAFIHDKDLVTDSYFEAVTRPHTISGSTQVYLAIQRKRFFDTLSHEVRLLAEMDVPVLLVWGREDKAIPLRCGHEMHRILRGSRLEILDDAGHVPNFERAEAFNRLALDFLRNG